MKLSGLLMKYSAFVSEVLEEGQKRVQVSCLSHL